MADALAESVVLDSLQAVEKAMARLSTIDNAQRSLTTDRDQQVLAITKHFAPRLATLLAEDVKLRWQLELYVRTHPEALTGKSLQTQYGVIGTRTGTGALALLEGWTWETARARCIELWKKRFLQTPKPPDLDKNRLKKLAPDQLAEAGMWIEKSETVFVELDRPAKADEAAMTQQSAA